MSLYPKEAREFYLENRIKYIKLVKQKFHFMHIVALFSKKLDDVVKTL